MTTRSRWIAGALLVAALAFTGCNGGGEGDGSSITTPPPDTTDELPAGLVLDAAPEGAVEIAKVKASAKEGDEVVVRGQVGGSREPFVAGRAALTIADGDVLTSCDEMPADGCDAPWDYCCEDPAKIMANSATIQVVGADGRPLKASLEGVGGIEGLKVILVKGVVGPRPDPNVLVINATGIFVEQ